MPLKTRFSGHAADAGNAMLFSIITPSFRASQWLKLCIASVADQGVEHEHIVQDACSDDGTPDWLPRDARVKAVIEKDAGMYDALNRGLRRARGELLAYLNADEQYLPGALAAVREFFEQHPTVDVVFGDAIVVNESGGYLCERSALTPRLWHTLVSGNVSFLTCGTFFRQRVIRELNLYFDTRYQVIGDADWARRLCEHRVSSAVLGRFTSTFTEMDGNLSFAPRAAVEYQAFVGSAPWLARRLRWLVLAHHRWRRWRAGAYAPKPHDYAIYTLESPDQRRTFHVAHPTFRWKRRGPNADGG